MKDTTTKLWLSDLLGCKIVTNEGKVIGYVRDIELTTDPRYQVKALLFGWGGITNHFHIAQPFRKQQKKTAKPDAIPWEEVASLKDRTIYLKSTFTENKISVAGEHS